MNERDIEVNDFDENLFSENFNQVVDVVSKRAGFKSANNFDTRMRNIGDEMFNRKPALGNNIISENVEKSMKVVENYTNGLGGGTVSIANIAKKLSLRIGENVPKQISKVSQILCWYLKMADILLA